MRCVSSGAGAFNELRSVRDARFGSGEGTTVEPPARGRAVRASGPRVRVSMKQEAAVGAACRPMATSPLDGLADLPRGPRVRVHRWNCREHVFVVGCWSGTGCESAAQGGWLVGWPSARRGGRSTGSPASRCLLSEPPRKYQLWGVRKRWGWLVVGPMAQTGKADIARIVHNPRVLSVLRPQSGARPHLVAAPLCVCCRAHVVSSALADGDVAVGSEISGIALGRPCLLLAVSDGRQLSGRGVIVSLRQRLGL